MKRCRTCHVEKPLDSFGRRGRDGLYARCKACRREERRLRDGWLPRDDGAMVADDRDARFTATVREALDRARREGEPFETAWRTTMAALWPARPPASFGKDEDPPPGEEESVLRFFRRHCEAGYERREPERYCAREGCNSLERMCARCRAVGGVCVNGHPLTFENVYVRPHGVAPDCRTCKRAAKARFERRRRGEDLDQGDRPAGGIAPPAESGPRHEQEGNR